MPQFTPVPFAGGSYADETMPFSSQETINYLPVRSERPGARSEWILKRAPGLRPYCGVGDGPIRGMHDAEGRRFVVSGTGFYEVSNSGVATLRGTVPGIRRVSIDHNQITGGNEVIVVNGDAGFVWNTVTQTFVTITDAAYPGATTVRYMGQYLCQIEPFRRFWFHSDLAAATQYLSTDRYEAESAPDLLQCLEVNQGELLVFGGRTTEVWRNIADGNSAFSRATVIERGAASPHSTCVLDQTVLFLGDDGIFYRLQGYTPVRISTHPLEQVFAQYDLSRAFCFTWEEVGHKVVYLSFQNGPTFGFDVATQEWHQRKTYGLDRWRVNDTVRWGQRWYAGDYTNGNIYLIDRSYGFDGCEPIERIRTFAVLHANGNRVGVDAVRIEVDTGGVASAAPTNLVVTGDLPDMTEASQSTFSYTVEGQYPGQTAYFELISGALPTGLSILGSGQVTGIATTLGEYSWTFRATDECGNTYTRSDASEVTETTLVALNAEALPLASTVIEWSPDGNYLASSGYAAGQPNPAWDDMCIVIHKRVGDTFTQIDPGHNLTDRAQGLKWANDSESLLVAGDVGNVFEVNRVGDVFTVGATYPDGGIFTQERGVNYSGDEQYVFVQYSDDSIKRWTVGGILSGSGISLSGTPLAFQPMGYHPDMHRAAVATSDSKVIILSADSGDLAEIATLTTTANCFQARYSPDGNWLAVANSDGCHIWSIAGDVYTPVTGLPAMDPCTSLSWSSDSFHLLVGPYYLKRSGSTFVQQAALPFSANTVGAASHAQNGQYLAVSSNGIWIYRVDL